jgi:hypothetical protein
MIPVFTRYLYERHQVEYSLQCALLAKCREEALYWAYELYHSGETAQSERTNQDDVWHWVRNLYVEFYEETNPRFKKLLDQWYAEWKESRDPCLLGTVVGTLAIRDRPRSRDREVEGENTEKFVILYKEDRHQTQEVAGKPRNYLRQVSQYPIRKEAIDLANYVLGISPEKVREAYLGPNWVYYCAETPIWASRIQEGRGKVLDGRVVFESDDDLEAFYERWGLEPDEQCAEMHRWHGICTIGQ